MLEWDCLLVKLEERFDGGKRDCIITITKICTCSELGWNTGIFPFVVLLWFSVHHRCCIFCKLKLRLWLTFLPSSLYCDGLEPTWSISEICLYRCISSNNLEMGEGTIIRTVDLDDCCYLWLEPRPKKIASRGQPIIKLKSECYLTAIEELFLS